jgi:hypothetical protein
MRLMHRFEPAIAAVVVVAPIAAGCRQAPKAQAAAPTPVVVSSSMQTASATDQRHSAVADQKPQPASASTLEKRCKQAEQRAMAAIESGDLAAAERDLRQLLADAEAEGDFTGLFLHYELAWLRWAARDLKGSLDEVGAADAYLGRSRLIGNSSVYQSQNLLWLRALFLIELAGEAPVSSRAGLIARARAARSDFEVHAPGLGQQPQADLLTALLAVRTGNRALADKLSRDFHLGDTEASELFIMVQVYLSIGRTAEADETRRAIEQAEPSVLRAVVLRRLTR